MKHRKEKNKNKLHNRERRETLWDVAILSPQYILYIGLTIVPFLISLPIVFTNQINFLDTDFDFVGLENFITIFKAPLVNEFLPALKKTGLFFLGNYAMIFIIGLPLALFMFEFEKKYSKVKNFFYTIIFIPWMLSGVGVGLLISALFARETGSINLLLLKIGLLNNAINVRDPGNSIVIMLFTVGWRAAGFNMALLLSGLLSIPRETIESAEVDGASYGQKMLYIYFPQMIPCIAMASIFCLMGSFAIFDVCVGLGGLKGNPGVRFISIIIYQLGFGSLGSAGNSGSNIGTLAQGIAVQLTVFVPLMIIAMLIKRVQKEN